MKYPLESKHYSHLIKWAKLNGLDVKHGATTAEEVIQLIQIAYPGTVEIELSEEAEPVAAAAPPVVDAVTGKPSTHYKNDPHVIVNIQTNPENGGAHPVPICVNGDHILVKRNLDVPIPYRFYLALTMAVETVYRQEFNAASGKPDTIIEQRPAFQYTAKGIPSDEVIAAWRERTKDIGREKSEDPSLKSDQAMELLAGKLLEKLTQAAA